MTMDNEYNISGRGLLSLPLQENGYPILRDSNNDENVLTATRERLGMGPDGDEFTIYDYDITPVTNVVLKDTTVISTSNSGGRDYYQVFIAVASICNRFEVPGTGVDVSDLDIEVSTDGIAWTEITDKLVEITTGGDIHAEFTNTTAYQYYRFSLPDTEPTLTSSSIQLHLNDASFNIETNASLENLYDGSVKIYKAPFPGVDGTENARPDDWSRVYGTRAIRNYSDAIIVDNGFIRVVLNGAGGDGNGYVEIFGYISGDVDNGWRSLLKSGDDWKIVRVNNIVKNTYNHIIISFTHVDSNNKVNETQLSLTRGQQMAEFEVVTWAAGASDSQFFISPDDRFTQLFTVDDTIIDLNTATTGALNTTTENWVIAQRNNSISDVVISSTHQNVFTIKVTKIVYGMASASMASLPMGAF